MDCGGEHIIGQWCSICKIINKALKNNLTLGSEQEFSQTLYNGIFILFLFCQETD